jgi:hypothetical protein
MGKSQLMQSVQLRLQRNSSRLGKPWRLFAFWPVHLGLPVTSGRDNVAVLAKPISGPLSHPPFP